MNITSIAIGAVVGATLLPAGGLILGITSLGPVAGGLYATIQSSGVVLPLVQSTLMTVGPGAVAKCSLIGAITGSFF